jgi:hypothetical protein
MDHLGIIKGTDDLEDSIDRTDVGQECIPEPSTRRSTSSETSNVDAGQEGGNLVGGLVNTT